jgi:hypothetical protein
MTSSSQMRPQTLLLSPPFQQDAGYAWLAPVAVEGDSVSISKYSSDLILYEDGIPLGPARSAHTQIREQGAGRFSHWQDRIYFSTRDNTDPNINGRVYTATVTPRDMAEDQAEYGLRLTEVYQGWLGLCGTGPSALPFQGLKIFELGPGLSMSTALAMAAFGATVYVTEREPIVWDPKCHGAIAKKMLDLLRRSGRPFNPEPLACSLVENRFDPRHIVVLNEARPLILPRLAGQIDHTFSAMVLEHVEDLERDFRFLHAISAPKARSAHLVDFGDHHYPEQPLEFLAESEEDFLQSCQYLYSRGSRLRFQHLKQAAISAGFRVEESVQDRVDPTYLADFIPRLRQSPSRFKDTPADWLETRTAVVYLEKG